MPPVSVRRRGVPLGGAGQAYPLVLMESLSNGVMPAALNFSGSAEGLIYLVPHLGEQLVASMRLPLEPATCVAGIADRLAALLGETRAADFGDRLRAIAVTEYDWSVRAAVWRLRALMSTRDGDPTSGDVRSPVAGATGVGTVRVCAGRFREPDVAFRCANGQKKGNEFWTGADLVAEVVSGGAEDKARDHVVKRQEYADAGIPEYWIVDPFDENITVSAALRRTPKALRRGNQARAATWCA